VPAAGLSHGLRNVGLPEELQRAGLPDEPRSAHPSDEVRSTGSPDELRGAGFPDRLRGAGLPDRLRGTLFPWKDELSAGIDADAFEASFLRKPDLFIRIRPGHEQSVREKLDAAGITYGVEGACVTLPAATKLEGRLEVD